MDYNTFERWAQSNEKEFKKDILRNKIGKYLVIIFIIIILGIGYLQIRDINLPRWIGIFILIFILGFPFVLSLTDQKLKFGEFISILLMEIANQIQIYQPKEKHRLFEYLKLLNKNFKPKKILKNDDFTPYEKYEEIKTKFENNMFLLSKHLHAAMKDNNLKTIQPIQIKLLASNIFNQDDVMYQQPEQIIKKYPYGYQFPKWYDFIKKFSLPKNQWILLIIWEIMITVFLYFIWIIFKLDLDTLFIGFVTLTGAIAYIIFKK